MPRVPVVIVLVSLLLTALIAAGHAVGAEDAPVLPAVAHQAAPKLPLPDRPDPIPAPVTPTRRTPSPQPATPRPQTPSTPTPSTSDTPSTDGPTQLTPEELAAQEAAAAAEQRALARRAALRAAAQRRARERRAVMVASHRAATDTARSARVVSGATTRSVEAARRQEYRADYGRRTSGSGDVTLPLLAILIGATGGAGWYSLRAARSGGGVAIVAWPQMAALSTLAIGWLVLIWRVTGVN